MKILIWKIDPIENKRSTSHLLRFPGKPSSIVHDVFGLVRSLSSSHHSLINSLSGLRHLFEILVERNYLAALVNSFSQARVNLLPSGSIVCEKGEICLVSEAGEGCLRWFLQVCEADPECERIYPCLTPYCPQAAPTEVSFSKSFCQV